MTLALRSLDSSAPGFDGELAALLAYSAEADRAIESSVESILADAIVDLVASGNTLKANALVEVEEIMQISARLVVNKAALKLDREPIRALIDSLAAAVAAAGTA